MRNAGYIFILFALSFILAACENEALVGVPSDNYAAPKYLANSKWVATEDGATVNLRYTAELKGGEDVGANFGKLVVARNRDMTNTVAVSDVSVVGGKVSGTVSFMATGGYSYYAQAMVGRSESVYLTSDVYTYTLLLPELDTQLSEISWFSVSVSSGTINLFGQYCTDAGVIFSCDQNKMTLETAKRKQKISLSGSSFSRRIYVNAAAEDAGIDQTNGTAYYIRTYATTAAGTGYGPIVKFNTVKWPGISNVNVVDVTATSARLNYSLAPASNDKSTIIEKVAYGTSSSINSATIIGGHVMTGLTPSTTYYCRYYFSNKYDENIWRTDALSFQTLSLTQVPEGAIDLGLSVYWATSNLGASKPEEYGDYYAWGETETKSTYNWTTYKLCNGFDNTLTRYNFNSSYGTVDYKYTLDSDDDVVRVVLGGSWRMPTNAEWTELRNKCSHLWTTENGIYGCKVTGPNGNSIFLPAAGDWYYGSVTSVGTYGNYWSSSLDTGDPTSAFMQFFSSNQFLSGTLFRYYGFSIRPVTD